MHVCMPLMCVECARCVLCIKAAPLPPPAPPPVACSRDFLLEVLCLLAQCLLQLTQLLLHLLAHVQELLQGGSEERGWGAVCVCVCVRARACVRACMRVCVCGVGGWGGIYPPIQGQECPKGGERMGGWVGVGVAGLFIQRGPGLIQPRPSSITSSPSPPPSPARHHRHQLTTPPSVCLPITPPAT